MADFEQTEAFTKAAQRLGEKRPGAKTELLVALKELQKVKSHMEVAYEILFDEKIKHYAHMKLVATVSWVEVAAVFNVTGFSVLANYGQGALPAQDLLLCGHSMRTTCGS